MRTANPTLNEDTFEKFSKAGYFNHAEGRMTIEGTANKAGILLLLTVISAAFTWNFALTNPDAEQWIMGLAFGGAIGGFILAMITSFKPSVAPITSPIYALLKGIFLGTFSLILNVRFPGIVPQAVALTFGVMAVMLVAYRTGLLRASGKFILGVVAATGAIALLYLAVIVGSLFNPEIGTFLWQPSPLSIGISLVVVTIAALNLVLDFDLIESGRETRRTEVDGMVQRVWSPCHPCLAVHGNPAPPVLTLTTQLVRRGREESGGQKGGGRGFHHRGQREEVVRRQESE